jgi:hypothetical protein
MIPEFLKSRIELKYGKDIKYPKDCDGLAAEISKCCNANISSTTLKRLFGIIELKNQPRLYTLDIVAEYAGFKSWKAALEGDALNENSYFESCNRIIVKNLMANQQIKIQYKPNRILKLRYKENSHFVVIYAENCKLDVNDEVVIFQLEIGYPLVCEKVMRNSIDLGSYVGGKEGGITQLIVE